MRCNDFVFDSFVLPFLFLFNCCVNDLIFRRKKRRKVNPPKRKKKISN